MISKETDFPRLNGLVLAGGKSRRMGNPKDKINWHGKEQRYYAADLLAPFCEEVFISCRQDQLENFNSDYNALTDTFLDMGPFGGILSALRSQREKAWLVVACDLPLLDKNALEFLIQSRNPEKAATTYESPFDGLPEPLITIWEPKSYPLLLNFLGSGNTCPRKVLINSDTLILKPDNPDSLMNVNTPEDKAKAQEILRK
ncbi:NTP transferase domain-containing protein [Chryseobacterium sp. PTM-20240506]|uniref:NTP transferase domain-containing protein n=1 Tax=unclassified Chryseobacterium TaxID=2593645 RepID=UPI00155302B7|nr:MULTISPECIES: NTP transferase domain-containing protein [unclassified Chryseobacterium]MDC8106996.1 NTP transferase domain-containing protein [Chryseobacterium sp. B21-037]MDQ1802383.1 NTP transferase domain-containing protein [Chryseobacterium sp. CKR4-1]